MRSSIHVWFGLVVSAWAAVLLIVVAPSPAVAQPTADPASAGEEDAVGPVAKPTLESARVLRMGGTYEKAIEEYEAILNEHSDGDGPAWATAVKAACGLATCYLETGRYNEAIETLRSVEWPAGTPAGESADDGGGAGAEQGPLPSGSRLGRLQGRGSEMAEWHRTLAEVLTVVGRYAEAIEHAGRAIELDPQDHQARFRLGWLYELTGRRDQAIDVYEFFDRLLLRKVPTDAAELTAAAQGFYRYSVLTRHPNLNQRTIHTLQELYQPAYERLDRTYWPARLAAADLLRSKFKNEEAVEDYEAALRINGRLAAAHVGIGWAALDGWQFEEVERRVELAKECNPKATEAFLLEAALKLTERRYDAGLAAAEAASAINPHDLAALGYAAAGKLCLGETEAVEDLRARADGVSAKPSAFHRILGDTLSGLRRYAESEAAYRLAIEADPTDPHPRTELGLMYMQWGEEAKARLALEAAWQLDQFDARTHNTLKLLETLEGFAARETEHFIIRYEEAADAVLAGYAADYLENIYEEVCEDHAWHPQEKTIIEIFPSHRMFGVRITGKPWIHTVGACTGRVIALEAARRGPDLQGPYNYAEVLRHEFTHTVTLGATNNRVDHWFTEGLAVMQENSPRSFSWRRLLADAVRRGELFTLESIDWGFIRPKRPTDRTLAYAQSEWMCEYIVARFGYEALNRLLAAYREGTRSAELLDRVLGVSRERFDPDFAGWAREQAGQWGLDLSPPEDVDEMKQLVKADPEDAKAHGRLARAELDAGNVEEALDAARAGLKVDGDEVLCLTVLGKVLWSQRQDARHEREEHRIDEELVPAMERLLKLDESAWIAPTVLGSIALKEDRFEDALTYLNKLKAIRPLDPTSYSGLAGIHLKRGEYELALPMLLELARSEGDDGEVFATIGMIFARRGNLGEARFWYTRSLHVDAFDPAKHQGLADVCMRMGDTRAAIKEYEVLCTLEPEKVTHFERAAIAYNKIGDAAGAARQAERAVALDPNTSVRSLIKKDED